MSLDLRPCPGTPSRSLDQVEGPPSSYLVPTCLSLLVPLTPSDALPARGAQSLSGPLSQALPLKLLVGAPTSTDVLGRDTVYLVPVAPARVRPDLARHGLPGGPVSVSRADESMGDFVQDGIPTLVLAVPLE